MKIALDPLRPMRSWRELFFSSGPVQELPQSQTKRIRPERVALSAATLSTIKPIPIALDQR
jgi:hypothetical protein